MNRQTLIISLVIVAGVATVLAWRSGVFGPTKPADVVITVPPLTATAQAGSVLFEANCAPCHGPNGSGSKNGPPLIHKIYEPGHHGDGAFYLAAMQGVRAHHWPFGNMPPVEGVSQEDVGLIVAFVREVQRANGID
jgi:mono/diheme cytochrome c family protein